MGTAPNAPGVPPPGLVPAVEITRGPITESVHHAAVAVVDADGKLVAHFGDPDLVTFSRSTLKPFQAMPTVKRGFPQRFGLETLHLALVCASHSGEERHVQAAGEILRAIGANADDLQCGVHVPLSYRPDDGAMPAKSEFTTLHNNCSGKHSGMLALAKMLDWPFAQYLDYDSPGQRAIRAAISEMMNVDADKLPVGTDGCSAPNYAMPIRSLALGYARLAHAHARNGAPATIVSAMIRHPEMVSGMGRIDLAIAEASEGTVFAKAGGEAVYCLGIPSRGLGITIKIGDGGPRALGPLVVDVLRQLGVLDDAALSRLELIAHPQLRNHRGIVIGTAKCVAALQMV